MSGEEAEKLFDELFVDFDDFDYLLRQKPLLAHYTSIHVLEKIMKHEELWFSNPLFMNDLEEMRFGIHQGKLLFEKLKTEIAQAAGSLERFEALERAFMGFFNEFGNTHALDVYVFCLSELKRGDEDGVLSMWRAYGGNGNGAALVFKTDFLTAPNDESPLLLSRVRYASGQERTAWLEAKIRGWCEIIKSIELPVDKLDLAAHRLFSVIKLYALTSKHSGFHEEDEWRLIYLPDRDRASIMKGRFDYVIGKTGVEPKLKFKIEPFHIPNAETWTFDSILDRIILGPTQSSLLAKITVLRMLELIEKPNFRARVGSSQIPLRPS